MYICFFSLFRYYLPLEKDVVLHLNELETQKRFVPSLDEFRKFEKFTTTTTGNGQILIRKPHFSLRLRWAKYKNINSFGAVHETMDFKPIIQLFMSPLFYKSLTLNFIRSLQLWIWLIMYWLTSRSKIFHLHGDAIIAT